MFSQDSLRFVRWRGFQPEVQKLPVEQVMPVKPGHTSKRDLCPHNLPNHSNTCASAPTLPPFGLRRPGATSPPKTWPVDSKVIFFGLPPPACAGRGSARGTFCSVVLG